MFKNKKKGFSLIEMLVVIAIIAVLVSIVVPTVSGYTIRSAAATNAANLRAIKGKLSTMRVLHSSDFNTMMSEQGVVGSAITGIWGGILDGLYGEGVGDQTITGLMCSFTANNGVLTLYAPNVVIEDVPTSKKMKLEGSNKSNSVTLEEGIEMSVLITETDIIPSYGGYTIEQFADIAEDGKLDDHTVSAPAGGGGLAGEYCKLRGHHEDEDENEVCDDCGYPMGYHDCTDAVGDGDHLCDYADNCLNAVTSCDDATGDGNHTCDECGNTVTSCTDEDNDLTCDECGKCLCTATYTIKVGTCGTCTHSKMSHWLGSCSG